MIGVGDWGWGLGLGLGLELGIEIGNQDKGIEVREQGARAERIVTNLLLHGRSLNIGIQ